jgi:hypothetical protein
MSLDLVSSFPAKIFRSHNEKGPCLILVAKVTCTIEQGISRHAPHQEPVHENDAHEGDDPMARVRRCSDLGGEKPRAEVMLVGQPYAPGITRPVGLAARLAIGAVDKTITLPGGICSPNDLRDFGPVPFSRVADGNRAPVDQRLDGDSILADEVIVLENLVPGHLRLETRLPGTVVRASLEVIDLKQMNLTLCPDTLLIDVDRSILTVTWRWVLNLGSRPEPLGRIVVRVDERYTVPDINQPPLVTHPLPPATPEHHSSRLDRENEHATDRGAMPVMETPRPSRLGSESDHRTGRIQMRDGGPGVQSASDDAAKLRMPPDTIPPPPGALRPVTIACVETELLCCDAGLPTRLRRRRSWKATLGEHDLAVAHEGDLGDGAPADGAVIEILKRARPDAEPSAMTNTGRGDASRLVLLAGTFRILFDELDWLRLALEVAKPLMGADRRVGDAVSAAEVHLGIPGLRCVPDLVAQLSRTLIEAFATTPGARSRTFLRDCADQALLDARSFSRRQVLGGTWIRASLLPEGASESEALPLYLPESAAGTLPLLRSFEARVIGEVVTRHDSLEPSARALRVLALGRCIL